MGFAGYGLKEMKEELRKEKERVASKDKELALLANRLMEKEEEVDEMYYNFQILKEKYQIEDVDSVEMKKLKSRDRIELEKMKNIKEELEREVEKLEEERMELKKRVRMQAIEKGGRGIDLGLSKIGMEAVESYANQLRTDGDVSLMDQSPLQSRVEIQRLKTQLEKQKTSFQIAIAEKEAALQQMEKLTAKLEKKNELMQRMKQKLLSQQSKRSSSLPPSSPVSTAPVVVHSDRLPSEYSTLFKKESFEAQAVLTEVLEKLHQKEQELEATYKELREYKVNFEKLHDQTKKEGKEGTDPEKQDTKLAEPPQQNANLDLWTQILTLSQGPN
jgi:hypothetical protein